MRKQINTIVTNGVEEKKEVTYYTIDDITPENIHKIYYDFYSVIELGYCPICGHMMTLNGTKHENYAWCPICGLEGPKHWAPYQAVKMWADRSFTTVAKAMNFSPKRFKEFNNLDNFDAAHRKEIEEFILADQKKAELEASEAEDQEWGTCEERLKEESK